MEGLFFGACSVSHSAEAPLLGSQGYHPLERLYLGLPFGSRKLGKLACFSCFWVYCIPIKNMEAFQFANSFFTRTVARPAMSKYGFATWTRWGNGGAICSLSCRSYMSYWVNFVFKVNWAQVDSGSSGTTHPRASFCTADVTFQFLILAV